MYLHRRDWRDVVIISSMVSWQWGYQVRCLSATLPVCLFWVHLLRNCGADLTQGIAITFRVEKLERCGWPPDGEKSLMIRLAVSTEYRRVTDKQTDSKTSCDRNTTIAGIDQHPANSTSSDTDQQLNQPDPTIDSRRFQSL